MRRPKIFTWHIHGSYLYYLSQGFYDIYIPLGDAKKEGYIGRGTTFPFGKNVIEVPVAEVPNLEFDCILFQTAANYTHDQYEILTESQRKTPSIFLEHDPPQEHPTNTRHVVRDPKCIIVHVTYFNQLMWDNNDVPVTVIEHGVICPKPKYTGELEKGIVVINNLQSRGRRLGLDIYYELRKQIPIDLIGMNTKQIGGLGEVLHPELPEFISRYRFFLNPIRYTSLGLAVIEAMMMGIPVVGLATTEMVTVFRNNLNGIVHTDTRQLVSAMRRMLIDPGWARAVGAGGRAVAHQRFDINRFVHDWTSLFNTAITRSGNQEVHLSVRSSNEKADSIYQ
jgi:glycosyltransferase involved in cell wall biosynthesis